MKFLLDEKKSLEFYQGVEPLSFERTIKEDKRRAKDAMSPKSWMTPVGKKPRQLVVSCKDMEVSLKMTDIGQQSR